MIYIITLEIDSDLIAKELRDRLSQNLDQMEKDGHANRPICVKYLSEIRSNDGS